MGRIGRRNKSPQWLREDGAGWTCQEVNVGKCKNVKGSKRREMEEFGVCT